MRVPDLTTGRVPATVLAGTPAAHYLNRHHEAGGIVFPSTRTVLPRRRDSTAAPEPVLIRNDFDRYTGEQR